MDSKQFKEYKAIIDEAIRQVGLTENYTVHPAPLQGSDQTIFITTNRSRECILVVDGPEIHVLRRVRFQAPSEPTGYSFETKEVVNLAHPEGIVKLGLALKDLLNFSYLSKDDLG